MRVFAARTLLHQAARDVSYAVKNNPATPADSAILLETHGKELWLTGSNPCTQIQRRVKDVDVEEEGAVLLPLKSVDILAALPGEKVCLTSDLQSVTLQAGHTVFNLPTQPAEKYPKLDIALPASTAQFKGMDLRSLAKAVLPAADPTAADPALQCIRFCCAPEKAEALATDGRRLAVSSVPDEADGDMSAFFMQPSLNTLLRLVRPSDKLFFGISGNHAVFIGVDWLFYTLMSAEKNTNAQKLLELFVPVCRIEVDAGDMLQGIESVTACLLPDDDACIRLDISDGTLHLSAEGSGGTARYDVSAAGNFTAASYSYQPRLLTDSLRTLAGKAQLELDKSGVLLLSGIGTRNLIAPRGPARRSPAKKTKKRPKAA